VGAVPRKLERERRAGKPAADGDEGRVPHREK
jgi:hypothetical protein